jgi:hypothetical protein
MKIIQILKPILSILKIIFVLFLLTSRQVGQAVRPHFLAAFPNLPSFGGLAEGIHIVGKWDDWKEEEEEDAHSGTFFEAIFRAKLILNNKL